MALTGIAMGLFLVAHLSGNLLLFADETGAKFNHYAEFLESQFWLIPSEIGLVVIFLLHVYLAITLSIENRRARGATGYGRKAASDTSFASRSMIISGLIILVFLIIHLIDFKFGERGDGGLAGLVKGKLSSPLYSGFYIFAVAVLAFHLFHGFQSFFQTLGLRRPDYTPRVNFLCILLAIGLSVGFACIPIWLLLTNGGR
jgi:succinate dehydrogenase / fumarate reductase cytochrome b subunit